VLNISTTLEKIPANLSETPYASHHDTTIDNIRSYIKAGQEEGK
jgi:hypothetical protein